MEGLDAVVIESGTTPATDAQRGRPSKEDTMFTTTARTITGLATLLVASIGITLAAAPLSVDASGVAFDEAPSVVALEFAWHDGLVLLFSDANDDTGIATAVVRDAAAALGHGLASRSDIDAASISSGLVTDLRSGVVLTFDTSAMGELQAALGAQLEALGMQVSADAEQAGLWHASHGSTAYRLVFAHDGSDLIRVYVGS